MLRSKIKSVFFSYKNCLADQKKIGGIGWRTTARCSLSISTHKITPQTSRLDRRAYRLAVYDTYSLCANYCLHKSIKLIGRFQQIFAMGGTYVTGA